MPIDSFESSLLFKDNDEQIKSWEFSLLWNLSIENMLIKSLDEKSKIP